MDSKLRVDIQALRGIAVLLVVCYHARLLPLPAGYLGVDVFFVISGFLITTQIAEKINHGTFTFSSFYLRRAWRLLPAAYCVLVFTLGLSVVFLNEPEMNELIEQLVGSVFLVSNVVLWLQTGYFESAAELKPLLHTWSLSIEEQYYLILPLLLTLLRMKWWVLSAIFFTVASLLLYEYAAPTAPGASFYLLPTRVWELGIGSILALTSLSKTRVFNLSKLAGYPALAALCLIPFLPISGVGISSINMVVVCVCTAVIIDARFHWVAKNSIAIALAKVGTISYSLYLVHWPIIALLNNANVGGGGLWWPVRLGAVMASFGLAYLLYQFVEQRYRYFDAEKSSNFNANKILVGCSFLIVLTIGMFSLFKPSNEIGLHRTDKIDGLSFECGELGFATNPSCRTHPAPEVLVWGDSYAMHWVNGLIDQKVSLVQATKSTCAPIVDLALFTNPDFGTKWGRGCIDFNTQVLADLERLDSVKLVVLGGQWQYLFAPENLFYQDHEYGVVKSTSERLTKQLIYTIEAIRALGKKVVLLKPPPSIGFDIGRCIERKNSGSIYFGAPRDCKIPYVDYVKTAGSVSDVLSKSAKETQTTLIGLDSILCDQSKCLTEFEGAVVYKDAGHLSREGSVKMAEKLRLRELIALEIAKADVN